MVCLDIGLPEYCAVCPCVCEEHWTCQALNVIDRGKCHKAAIDGVRRDCPLVRQDKSDVVRLINTLDSVLDDFADRGCDPDPEAETICNQMKSKYMAGNGGKEK